MKTSKINWGLLVISAALFLLAASSVRPTAAQAPEPRSANANATVLPSSFDGDVRNLPYTRIARKNDFREVGRPTDEATIKTSGNDPVVQTVMPPLNVPTPTLTFAGLDKATWGAGYPPDTVGDVGPNHYIQAVNTSVGIYSKSGTQLAAFTFESFWVGANTGTPCDGNVTTPRHAGDPLVLYDPLSNRWIFADFAWTDLANGPYFECFAVSKTADPLSGGWWRYALRADDNAHPYLADYPKIGLWPDGIYMSANMFDVASNGNATYMGARVWALNRADMESGAPLRSFVNDLSSSYFSLLPSNLRGNIPPSGTPNYFVSNSATAAFSLYVWKFSVDPTWTAATFTGPTAISQNTYTAPPSLVPELSSNSLDSLGDRLMMQNQYRNIGGTESVWVTHIVGFSGIAALRWYQINVTGGTIVSTPVQQATYAPDTTHRWIPSLSLDRMGNLAIGFSASNSTIYPAIRLAGRLATDAPNTLGQGETTLFAGTGGQTNNCGGGTCRRWGDYSAMSTDPTDDCTFWYTSEYYAASGGNWQTRIGSFKYSSCNAPVLTLKLFMPLVKR